ncbi:DUF3459 domain-containing protein [Nonomuraea angiospora]|uniref:DUF3459 domain-containing protein n=1 Tax=Nonomuraea angiospora TaxID=46172 RepID=UPI0029BCFC4F|nr:DUF3459 domain-containing protein [Nonomuraea angiospora]MDX3101945.1 DUF3459 domain-containing protein [Nonomuraea angiospora]
MSAELASRIGTERVPGALALLLTLKGTPTLYYGDELGLPDAPVDAGRARDCAELRSRLSRVRELLKLRREPAALRQGDITVLSAHPDHLAYLRGDGEDSLVVAVNLSGRDQRVAFPGVRSTLWSSSFTGGERDRLPGEVTLAPFEARLLR